MPTIPADKAMEIIRSNLDANGKIPDARSIAALFDFTDGQAHNLMRELNKRGRVRKKGNWYEMPVSRQIEKPEPKVEEKQPEEPEIIPPQIVQEPPGRDIIAEQVSQEPEEKKTASKSISVKIVRYGLFFVGAGAAVISVYFTSRKTTDILPWPLAFLFSLTIIAYLIFSLDAAIIYYTRKKKVIATSLLFSWFIAMAISFMAMLAGQYEANSNKIKVLSENESEAISGERRLAALENKTVLLKERIAGKYQEIKFHRSRVIDEKDVSLWKLSKAERDIERLQSELDAAQEEMNSIIEKSPEVAEGRRKGFVDWISETTGIGKNIIELILSVLPAVFVDLIAPVAIAVALFIEE